MKKAFLIIILTISTFGFPQKKKSASKTPVKNVLATLDNISAEIITDKKLKKIVLFVTNGAVKDTIEVKKIESSSFNPINFKLTSFTTNGVKLYHINWEEKNKIDTKIKKEDQDITESQIWNIEKKELLIGNTYKAIHIVETVFLDKNKTASETQEKNKKEGLEFILLPNGDFTLQNKTQKNDYAYNTSTMRYEIKKGSVTKPTSTRKKR